MKVTVTANANASSRTKSRLREHPGEFELVRTDNVQCLGGRLAHDLRHPDGWFGWIPADEVEVQSVN